MRQTKTPQSNDTPDTPGTPVVIRAGILVWVFLTAVVLIIPAFNSGSSAGGIGGVFGILLSLGVVGYWFFQFRTRRATLRDVFILFVGLSVEVGFIVNGFKPDADGMTGLVAFIFPLILATVLLLSDDTPLSARTKLLMRKRVEFRLTHIKKSSAPSNTADAPEHAPATPSASN